jgi:ATPase subunit of ABC transporter with duplicated ATPase domains
VSLIVSGEKDHNGFILSEPFTHHGNLIVLTGRNGSGKTRLLESIQQRKSTVNLDGELLTNQEVMLVLQAQLTPNFGGAYNDAQFQQKITSSLQQFDRIKGSLDEPFNLQKHQERHRMGMMVDDDNVIPYEFFHSQCNSIASRLNKLASELTHDEIKLYFEDNIHTVLGFQNISSI